MKTVNDLSEDLHTEIDNIYNAIVALSAKSSLINKTRTPIGYPIHQDNNKNKNREI